MKVKVCLSEVEIDCIDVFAATLLGNIVLDNGSHLEYRDSKLNYCEFKCDEHNCIYDCRDITKMLEECNENAPGDKKLIEFTLRYFS